MPNFAYFGKPLLKIIPLSEEFSSETGARKFRLKQKGSIRLDYFSFKIVEGVHTIQARDMSRNLTCLSFTRTNRTWMVQKVFENFRPSSKKKEATKKQRHMLSQLWKHYAPREEGTKVRQNTFDQF